MLRYVNKIRIRITVMYEIKIPPITNYETISQRETSSFAVAKRPRDASCLSVVSFNSTKRRAQSFIVIIT